MSKHGSRMIALMIARALMIFATGAAQAQTYPTKPVRFLVGFAPGGGVDVSARILSQRMSEMLGQTWVVDNRAGAGGTIATDIAARAPADGYSLLFCGIWSHGVAPSLYKKLPYDHYKDFAPVTMIGTTPNVLVVNPALPVKSVSEFIAYTKANDGKIIIATPGSGSSPHLTMELFRLTTGINIVHVKVLSAPDTQRRLLEQGVDAAPSTPEQFAAFIKVETDKWAKVVRDAGVPQQ